MTKAEAAEQLLKSVEDNFEDDLFIPLKVVSEHLKDHCVGCENFRTDCPNCPTCDRHFFSFFSANCDCPDPDSGPDIESTTLFYGCGIACPAGNWPRMYKSDFQ